MIKTVIWDYNGTILDDTKLCYDIFIESMQEQKLDRLISFTEYRNNFRFPVIEFYKQYNFDFDLKSYEEISDDFIKQYLAHEHELNLVQGVKEKLEQLKDEGVQNIIISACQDDILNRQVQLYGIAKYFTDIIGLKDVLAYSKKELAINWLKQAKLNPQEVLWVGDSVHDYECAHACGCHSVLVASGHQSYDVLLNSAPYVIESIADFDQFMQKIN